MGWSEVNPVYDPNMMALCRKPYPGHPKGCPNWRKAERCPPKAPMIHKALNLSRPVFAVWNVFDLASHIQKMQHRHMDWTWRQLVNCLYWQGTARKQLKAEIAKAQAEISYDTSEVLTCPEACGVNVTETMNKLCHRLEWPPKTKTYQVALIGEPLGHITQPEQGRLF